MNCTPFVRQVIYLLNKRGAFVCLKGNANIQEKKKVVSRIFRKLVDKVSQTACSVVK